jgi:hypothetical protein
MWRPFLLPGRQRFRGQFPGRLSGGPRRPVPGGRPVPRGGASRARAALETAQKRHAGDSGGLSGAHCEPVGTSQAGGKGRGGVSVPGQAFARVRPSKGESGN